MMDSLLLAHAATTLILVGLIWTVQVVHYPLLRHAGRDQFVALHAAHAQRMTVLVAALMPLEAILVLVLALARGTVLTWTGVLLVGVIWISTAFLQVPLHAKLARGFDPGAHRRLVGTNWIRTAAWTARGAIALVLLT